MQIIDTDYVRAVCHPKRPTCCAYLMMSAKGWTCAKDSIVCETAILKRLAQGTMRATGDNCAGYTATLMAIKEKMLWIEESC